MGFLNTFFAPRGGNLNKPILKSSNARGRGVARGDVEASIELTDTLLYVFLKALLEATAREDASNLSLCYSRRTHWIFMLSLSICRTLHVFQVRKAATELHPLF